ncbi:lipoyl synthase [Candidatus Woesearchaeota archaeon]|nr:lipoyl synthase [Candidatus Woesearchaeota archaeon]
MDWKPYYKIPEHIKPNRYDRKGYLEVMKKLREIGVITVCEEDLCPNRYYCYSKRTVTFLAMGNICTRRCKYCNIRKGKPLMLDPKEPERILEAAKLLGSEYIVITSVTRDDLSDGGASHLASIARLLKKNGFLVEVLAPDLKGLKESVDIVIDSGIDVFALNIETVERLYPEIRPGARYERILELLRHASRRVITKSGIILGMGESMSEVKQTIRDLAKSNVRIVTIGQYLRPGPEQIEVKRYYTMKEFKELKMYGESLGLIVESNPLVRSSFNAYESYLKAVKNEDKNNK